MGNLGRNTLYRASDQHPVQITAADFLQNGGFLAIPSLYLPDKNGELKEFPANGRDDLVERWPVLKKKYELYSTFGTATINDIITPEKISTALRLKANTLESCFVRNDGDGKFTIIPLPSLAQVSVINGMLADDFDGDGHLDVLINGNDYGTDIAIGRYDAMDGLLLKGNGEGGFTPLTIQQSGIYIPGNGKALVRLAGGKGEYMVAASQNKDLLKVFELSTRVQMIRVNPDDVVATLHFRNGKIRKEEFYYGTSFLSQSSRVISVTADVASVDITNRSGITRKLAF